MPINPNTHYVIEAKSLEASYVDCKTEAQVYAKNLKRSCIGIGILGLFSIILTIVTFIIAISPISISFILLILLCTGIVIGYILSSKNVAMDPEKDKDIQNIIYGDKYAITEANPEELHNYVKYLRINQGMIRSYNRGTFWVSIMLYVVYAISDVISISILLFQFI